MSEIDDGGAAFPVGGSISSRPGMSLRDWFAGQAMRACATSDPTPEAAARWSYLYADAMLSARKAEGVK